MFVFCLYSYLLFDQLFLERFPEAASENPWLPDSARLNLWPSFENHVFHALRIVLLSLRGAGG